MSNVEQYIKQFPTKIEELKTVLEGGIPISGADLTDIKTNTGNVSSCVNSSLHEMKVDLQGLGGTNISRGDGNNDGGCPRVTIARDDYNIKQLIANSSGYMNAFLVAIRGIHLGGGEEDIAVATGNVTAGTMRVCIADNDTNLSNIASHLTHIDVILTDCWDSGAHALRTI